MRTSRPTSITRKTAALSVLACRLFLHDSCLAEPSRGQLLQTTANHVELTSRELKVVIGNNQAGTGSQSKHRNRYNGIWSLTSIHEPENCFVPEYAGMNLEHFMDDLFMTKEGGDIFEPRNVKMKLQRVNRTSVRLIHEPSPMTGISSETVFTIKEPHLVDFHFKATLSRSPRAGDWMGFFWASYINAPESPALFFQDSSGRWSCLSADQHGGPRGANTISHHSIANAELGDGSREYRAGSLAHAHSTRRFKIPLMFGRPGDGRMMLLFMFDQAAPIRLTMSPTGGGQTAKTYNPAWDYQYIVPAAKRGTEVELRARLIYKLYQGREEIAELYKTWKNELASGERS